MLLKWKKRLKIALAAKSIFPETQEFIENTLREECEKEKMIADERFFFFASLEAKQLAWINIFVLDLAPLPSAILLFCRRLIKYH